jgi:hypothetical protein
MVFSLVASFGYSQEGGNSIPGSPELYDENQDIALKPTFDRYHLTLSLFSIYEAPIGKTGVTFGYLNDDRDYYELSYLTGSLGVLGTLIDIGSVSESSISFSKRYFWGESFNLKAGLSRREIKVVFGSEILADVLDDSLSSDLLSAVSYGVDVGIGNRWFYSNDWIIEFDWLGLYLPFSSDVDEGVSDNFRDGTTKTSIETAAEVLGLLPSVYVVKLNLGYRF